MSQQTNVKSFQIDNEDEIGKGGFSTVFGVINHFDKACKQTLLTERYSPDTEDTNIELKEVKVFDIINSMDKKCQNIITYYGHRINEIKSRRKGKKSTQYLEVFIEYCQGKSLHDYIQKYGKNGLSQDKVNHIIKQIIYAVLYIHSCGIVYCDIKPQNFLLKRDEEYPTIVASDFGVSIVFGDVTKESSSLCNPTIQFEGGTENYNAPETKNDRKITTLIDIWSLGVLLYELVTGSSVITVKEGDEERQLNIAEYRKEKCTRELPFPSNIDNTTRQFINRLLIVDPNHRMSWSELLYSDYINQEQRNTIGNRFMGTFDRQQQNKSWDVVKTLQEMRIECHKIESMIEEIKNIDTSNYTTFNQLKEKVESIKSKRSEAQEIIKTIQTKHNGLNIIDSQTIVTKANDLLMGMNSGIHKVIQDNVIQTYFSVIGYKIDELYTYQHKISINSKDDRIQILESSKSQFYRMKQETERLNQTLTSLSSYGIMIDISSINKSLVLIKDVYNGIEITVNQQLQMQRKIQEQERDEKQIYDFSIKNLQDQISNIENETTTKRNQIYSMRQQITTFDNQIRDLEQKIVSQFKILKEKIDTLKRMQYFQNPTNRRTQVCCPCCQQYNLV